MELSRIYNKHTGKELNEVRLVVTKCNIFAIVCLPIMYINAFVNSLLYNIMVVVYLGLFLLRHPIKFFKDYTVEESDMFNKLHYMYQNLPNPYLGSNYLMQVNMTAGTVLGHSHRVCMDLFEFFSYLFSQLVYNTGMLSLFGSTFSYASEDVHEVYTDGLYSSQVGSSTDMRVSIVGRPYVGDRGLEAYDTLDSILFEFTDGDNKKTISGLDIRVSFTDVLKEVFKKNMAVFEDESNEFLTQINNLCYIRFISYTSPISYTSFLNNNYTTNLMGYAYHRVDILIRKKSVSKSTLSKLRLGGYGVSDDGTLYKLPKRLDKSVLRIPDGVVMFKVNEVELPNPYYEMYTPSSFNHLMLGTTSVFDVFDLIEIKSLKVINIENVIYDILDTSVERDKPLVIRLTESDEVPIDNINDIIKFRMNYKKGSVKRALEIQTKSKTYILDLNKCKELIERKCNTI